VDVVDLPLRRCPVCGSEMHPFNPELN